MLLKIGEPAAMLSDVIRMRESKGLAEETLYGGVPFEFSRTLKWDIWANSLLRYEHDQDSVVSFRWVKFCEILMINKLLIHLYVIPYQFSILLILS